MKPVNLTFKYLAALKLASLEMLKIVTWSTYQNVLDRFKMNDITQASKESYMMPTQHFLQQNHPRHQVHQKGQCVYFQDYLHTCGSKCQADIKESSR